jgi:transposase
VTGKGDVARRRTATQAQRLQVVRRVQRGERPEDVARLSGYSRAAVFRWTAAYREGGEAALRSRKAPGRRRLLTAEQRAAMRELLLGLEPTEAGFTSALWTRAMVRELFAERFGVRLSAASATRFLEEERVLPRTAEACPRLGDRVNRAVDAGFAVGRFVNLPHPDGAALSVVWTNRTAWFGLYRGACTGTFTDFCRRLVHDSSRPVVLIGAPPLRELAGVARELAGRLVLLPGGEDL